MGKSLEEISSRELWQTAKIMYNKSDDGLTKEWAGRVWLNPPYSRPLIGQFVRKLAEHGNGIALLFNRFRRRECRSIKDMRHHR